VISPIIDLPDSSDSGWKKVKNLEHLDYANNMHNVIIDLFISVLSKWWKGNIEVIQDS